MCYVLYRKRGFVIFLLAFSSHPETYWLRTTNEISCFGNPLCGFPGLVSLGWDLECSHPDSSCWLKVDHTKGVLAMCNHAAEKAGIEDIEWWQGFQEQWVGNSPCLRPFQTSVCYKHTESWLEKVLRPAKPVGADFASILSRRKGNWHFFQSTQHCCTCLMTNPSLYENYASFYIIFQLRIETDFPHCLKLVAWFDPLGWLQAHRSCSGC